MEKKSEEVLIAGYVRDEITIRALVLGRRGKAGVDFCGLCEDGLHAREVQHQLVSLLQPLEVTATGLTRDLNLNFHITWVKPVLVAEVEYGSKTDEGVLFHPRFLWLRETKNIADHLRDASGTLPK